MPPNWQNLRFGYYLYLIDMRITLAIFLLLLISRLIYAQTEKPGELISAEDAYNRADYPGAIALYRQLKNSLDENEDQPLLIDCAIGISKSNLALGKFNDAISECTTGLGMAESSGSSTNNQMAELYKLLGEAYLNSGLNEQALDKFRLSARFTEQKNNLFYADLMEETGLAYWNSGNDQLALEHHNLALATRNDLLPERHELIADSYVNLGLVTLEEDYFNTLIYLKKALSIYEEKFGSEHLKVANVYFNLGLANLENKTLTQATTYFKKVEDIYKEIYPQDHPNKAIIQSTLARIDYELKDYEQAIGKFDKAAGIYQNIYGERHPELADTYGRIGEVYRDKGDYRKAIEFYQKAIYANLQSQDFQSFDDLPDLKNYFNADYLLRSLQAKAIALEEIHYNKTLKPKDINAALRTYALCDSLIAKIKQVRVSEEDKIKLSAIGNEVYEDGIRVSIDIANRSLNKKFYENMAYRFFERSKASTLLEAINDTQAKEFAGIPANVLEKETALINEIVALENLLLETGNDKDEEAEISRLLFEKNEEYRNFIDDLEKNYSAYFELKYKTSLTPSEEIRSALKDNEVILNYFISTEGENNEIKNLYIMAISRKKLSFYQQSLPDNFFNLLKGFRTTIKFKADASVRKIGHDLFNLFFPQELYSKYDFFTIIPDGSIGTIPFEALTDEEGLYVIETKNINYDFSANLYHANLSQKKTSKKNILAVAPVNFDSYDEVKLNALPATAREVDQLKRITKRSSYQVNMLRGSEASEKGLKSTALADYDILHFATHGEVNESEPNLSRIFLAPAAGEDGFLYSSEIYNLKLDASLITLSACETGLGKIAKGEGIIGLSRSLKYAGGQNLIVSLWQVADQSTSDLMISFYEKNLIENTTYAEALRNSKLLLLYSSSFSDPYYWAPFILIGK